MRAGIQDIKFLYNKKEEFVGINLGWDFCAEHEFGIDKLKTRLKNEKKNIIFGNMRFDGIDTCVLALPYEYTKLNDGTWFNKNCTIKAKRKSYFDFYSLRLKSKEIIASWDKSTFAICVLKKDEKKLELLYDAIQNDDVDVFQADRTSPFGSSGLCIVIKDALV